MCSFLQLLIHVEDCFFENRILKIKKTIYTITFIIIKGKIAYSEQYKTTCSNCDKLLPFSNSFRKFKT